MIFVFSQTMIKGFQDDNYLNHVINCLYFLTSFSFFLLLSCDYLGNDFLSAFL